MAVFTDLEATVAQIYETNEDIITKDGDDLVKTPDIPGIVDLNVKLIYKTKAIAQLKLDLQMAKGLPNDETTDIDALADDYTDFLNEALSKLQLFHFYTRLDEGEGSPTWERKMKYLKEYNEKRAMFNQLSLNDTNILIKQAVIKQWQ